MTRQEEIEKLIDLKRQGIRLRLESFMEHTLTDLADVTLLVVERKGLLNGDDSKSISRNRE